MFKVRKGNRILTVNETEKEFYLSEGYEVVEFDKDLNDYVVIEKATGGRTYSVAEYNKVVDELEALKAELAELKNSAVEPDREEVKAKLTELGVEFNDKAQTSTLVKLLEEKLGSGE